MRNTINSGFNSSPVSRLHTEYDVDQNVDEEYRPYAVTMSRPLRKTKKVRMHSQVSMIDQEQKVHSPLNDTKTLSGANTSFWAGNKY